MPISCQLLPPDRVLVASDAFSAFFDGFLQDYNIILVNPDSPHVVAIPPFVFLPGLLVGFSLEWLMPLNLFPGMAPKGVGFVLATISGILALRLHRDAPRRYEY